MASIHNSFSMEVPPEQAQAMFVGDIAPDLAKDGGFQPARESAGLLEFSDGLGDYLAPLDLDEVADPDDAGHEPEDDEPAVTAAEQPKELATFRGLNLLPVNVRYRTPRFYDELRRLTARHVRVQFEEDAGGTRVTITGSAEHDIRRGLDELGTQGHWPEIAGRPHD